MEDLLFKNAKVFQSGGFVRRDVFISGGRLVAPAHGPAVPFLELDGQDIVIIPGLADVHVHLREPGLSYKETIYTGTAAAAAGGYTTVCPMPNLDPVPDSLETLEEERRIIRQDAQIHVRPYGAITKGEKGQCLADMEAMAPYVCGFSDDGKGVQDEDMMRAAMKEAARLGKIIAAHCEDESLLHGGYIHEGDYARAHGHKGICAESEWGPIARDVRLAEETGCAYHVCHVSCAKSVEIIREAKARGVDVTCETGPHYLVLDDTMLQEDGRFKMNPPLRSPEDRMALLEGIKDGTIDMIATDHAPHSAEEKGRGLEKSLMGVVGLETAFPILYTELVRKNVLSLEELVERMCLAPRRRFGLGDEESFTIYDLGAGYEIDPERFLSKGRATPFAGRSVYGGCVMTVCDGKVVWRQDALLERLSQEAQG